MTASRTNPKVDGFFSRASKWQDAFAQLRSIVLECGLTEELKWGQPCYTIQGKNVVIIGGFKEYCALLFFKGALLQDPEGILIRQTEHVQAGRQIRFTDAKDIAAMAPVLTAYLQQAIAVERAGLKVVKERTAPVFPEEFQQRLDADPAVRAAFTALTPGRQRAYALYFSAAKQAKTRAARVEKCLPRILQGKGMDDD